MVTDHFGTDARTVLSKRAHTIRFFEKSQIMRQSRIDTVLQVPALESVPHTAFQTGPDASMTGKRINTRLKVHIVGHAISGMVRIKITKPEKQLFECLLIPVVR